jgi:hypothetical protein
MRVDTTCDCSSCPKRTCPPLTAPPHLIPNHTPSSRHTHNPLHTQPIPRLPQCPKLLRAPRILRNRLRHTIRNEPLLQRNHNMPLKPTPPIPLHNPDILRINNQSHARPPHTQLPSLRRNNPKQALPQQPRDAVPPVLRRNVQIVNMPAGLGVRSRAGGRSCGCEGGVVLLEGQGPDDGFNTDPSTGQERFFWVEDGVGGCDAYEGGAAGGEA